MSKIVEKGPHTHSRKACPHAFTVSISMAWNLQTCTMNNTHEVFTVSMIFTYHSFWHLPNVLI